MADAVSILFQYLRIRGSNIFEFLLENAVGEEGIGIEMLCFMEGGAMNNLEQMVESLVEPGDEPGGLKRTHEFEPKCLRLLWIPPRLHFGQELQSLRISLDSG